MTAPFIPPPLEFGATTTPTTSTSTTATAAPSQEPVAHTIPAVPGEPRPVAPAEEIGVPPAKALDAVAGEKGLLEKAREATMPYINKIQESTKPYVDAAEQKAEALFNKLDEKLDGASMPASASSGSFASTTPTSAAGTTDGLKSAPYAAGPGTGSASTGVNPDAHSVGRDASEVAGELGGKAKHFFEQGLATVSNAFTQVTHTLDEKTKTDTHPGIVTQATSAFQTGVHKVDDFLNEKTATTTTAASSQAGGPVQTTTNSVPHVAADAEAVVPVVVVPVVPVEKV